MGTPPLRRLPRKAQAFLRSDLPVSRRSFVRTVTATAGLTVALDQAAATAKSSMATTLIVPMHLSIPAIDVDADVEQLHIIDGVMDTPSDPWKVGWYSQLAMSDRAVDVVLAGHKDWWEVGPAVFWDLARLVAGDVITVTSHDALMSEYAIDGIEEVPVDLPPHTYLTGAGPNALTLITCAGAFDGHQYASRLIVRSHRIG